MATRRRCPKCNELNDTSATRCASCNTSLLQRCAVCGRTRPWYVARCAYCATQSDDDATTFARMFQSADKRSLQGHYVLSETVSVGRVSTVYRARSSRTPGLEYAIKEFSMVALFRPEERRSTEAGLLSTAQRWADLRHPAIPTIIDVFSEGSSAYVVTPYIEGLTLRSVIAERLTLTPELVRNWGAQLCQLLAYLHALAVPTHVPFLAPHHVVVTPEGVVKLLDWGLTAILNPGAYGPYGSIRGYMAPELRAGPPSPQSDVYALARLLYALLTDQLLEQGSASAQPLRKAVPGVSPEFAKALAQAAHRDPSARLTVDGLLAALWPDATAVAPIGGWVRVAVGAADTHDDDAGMAPAPTRPAARPRSQSGESMADMGFERDARFGTPAEAAAQPAVPPPPLASTRTHVTVQPRSLSVRGGSLAPTQQRLVLTLRNTGDAEVLARVSSHVDWIRAPQKSAVLAPGQQAKVILTVKSSELPAGSVSEPQALAVDYGGSRVWVGVSAETPSAPVLIIEQPLLDFGVLEDPSERTLPLVVRNGGLLPMLGTAVSRVPWLRVPNGAIRCAAGQSVSVAVQLRPDALPSGEQLVQDALLVESDGGQSRVGVRAWYKQPVMDLGTRLLDFCTVNGGELAERLLYVHNPGDGTLDGLARSLVPWLQVRPARFTCPPAETCELAVELDTVGLNDGDLSIPQALRVQSNAGSVTLPLRASIQAPRLVLDVQELDFGCIPLGEERTLPVTVRNSGSAPLEASLQAMAPWLSLEESSVSCAAGQSFVVRAHAHTSAFARGEELKGAPAIRVTAGSTVRDITARLIVTQPALRIEPESIEFGYIARTAAQSRSLTITNDGNGALAWNASSSAAWVEINPNMGLCPPGKSESITLTAYGLALEAESGVANGSLVVNSDGGRAKVDLHVGIAAPKLDVETMAVDLGPSVNGRSVAGELYLFNRGLGLLEGTFAADRPWLVPDRVSFECATGRSVCCVLSTDMAEYPGGAARDTALLRISSNGGDAEIRVTLELVAAPEITVPSEGVQLTRQTPDGPLTGTLTVRNSGMASAHISISSSGPQLELARADYEIKAGKSIKVRLALPVAQQMSASTEALTLAIATGSETIRVPVLWEQPTPGEQRQGKEIPQ